jgi:hypothetical protein
MSLVAFDTIAPYETVHVNPNELFAFRAEEQTPEDDTVLLADAAQSILVLAPVAAVAAKLGSDFRQLQTASKSSQPVYINRSRVLHILPHPQVKDVCLVHGLGRRIAVKGALGDVVKALS